MSAVTRATVVCALVALALMMVPATAMADPPTRAAGPLVDLQPDEENATDGARARVMVVGHARGSTVLLQVRGLDSDAAGTTLGAHVHVGPCIAGDGAAAGPHYNVDPGGPVTPATEVWLDSTVDPSGKATTVANVPFRIPPGAAGSVVIHALPTDATGAAGARLACIGIAL